VAHDALLGGGERGVQVLDRVGLTELPQEVALRDVEVGGGEADLLAIGALAPGIGQDVAERLRRDARYGGAAESVTAAKRARLLAAARLYLANRGAAACRFDVLLLDGLAPSRVQWIRNAFGE